MILKSTDRPLRGVCPMVVRSDVIYSNAMPSEIRPSIIVDLVVDICIDLLVLLLYIYYIEANMSLKY